MKWQALRISNSTYEVLKQKASEMGLSIVCAAETLITGERIERKSGRPKKHIDDISHE